jgi:hypothetical protein
MRTTPSCCAGSVGLAESSGEGHKASGSTQKTLFGGNVPQVQAAINCEIPRDEYGITMLISDCKGRPVEEKAFYRLYGKAMELAHDGADPKHVIKFINQ